MASSTIEPTQKIDKALLTLAETLANKFDIAIGQLAGSSSIDLRIFFTMAHGYITRSIAKCADLFNNANAIMRLNERFATQYLKAIGGKPHTGWVRVFEKSYGRSVPEPTTSFAAAYRKIIVRR
jgi:hypothetical protein